MNWDIVDFSVFGVMVLVAGLIVVGARRRSRNLKYRMAVVVAAIAAFLLLWVNAAVGIIGNENNDANMLFFAVPGVALLGALVARFRSHGMARTMYATATVQAAVAVVALLADWGSSAPLWPRDLLSISAFFIALWLLSAWLFHGADRERGRGVAPIKG